MLKTSNYLLISAFFVSIFVLFLLFNPDSYSIEPISDKNIIKKNESVENALLHSETSENEIALIVDDVSNSDIKKHISRTLFYLQHDYVVYNSVYDVGVAKTIIIATPNIKNSDIIPLRSFLANGGNVIFATLPESLTEEWKDLMGIVDSIPDYQVTGFDIYEGILLGGMFRAEKLMLDCSKVALTGKCKVFATGYDPNRDKTAPIIDEEDKNPLIWRTFLENGMIFVINASFMDEACGMGILTGVLSHTTDDFIYPVIGTKNVILDNFPYIGDDNNLVNGRTCQAFTRDIIWPGLVSISKDSDLVFTCYTNGDFSKSNDSYEVIRFLNSELYKTMNGEIGYSIKDDLSSSAFQKDISFLRSHFKSYDLRSFKFQSEGNRLASMDSVEQTSILTMDWGNAFRWVDDQTVTIPVINRGTQDEYTSLMLTSMISTLGLVMYNIDMEPLFTEDVAWNHYSIDIAKHFDYLFSKHNFLQSSSVKKTAELAKDYLNLNMKAESNGQSMNVSLTDHTGEISFILRTKKEIAMDKCTNCSILKIEDGAYLIKSADTGFSIEYEKQGLKQ